MHLGLESLLINGAVYGLLNGVPQTFTVIGGLKDLLGEISNQTVIFLVESRCVVRLPELPIDLRLLRSCQHPPNAGPSVAATPTESGTHHHGFDVEALGQAGQQFIQLTVNIASDLDGIQVVDSRI